MAPLRREAYCTLLTNDDYIPGAMVLAHSLRDNGTKKQLAVFVTLDTVSADAISELKTVYNQIIPVDRIINKSPANLYLMDRPDLHSAFTKIALWRQTQFDHLVYLDADVLSLRAPDELFNLPHPFAAVPDIGWPDCFNSGVLSLKPNMGDYYALLALAQRGISFDGADQGLLNMHFRNWERLSFTYNCTPSGNYQYTPAYRHFQSSISLVHYIGREKPWLVGRDRTSGGGVYDELVGRWWAVYDKHYRTPFESKGYRGSIQQSRIVQQHTMGERYNARAVSTAPKVPGISEPPLSEATIPTPTSQQRRYSTAWDPTREAPQPGSKPEAPDFPLRQYEMSQDRSLFQAPRTPEPPGGLHYEPPKPSLNPIFPWEDRARKPTRVFAEDLAPSPAPESIQTPSETGVSATEGSTEATSTTAEAGSPGPVSPGPFSTFTTSNAWDNNPSISRYVSSLSQNHRAKFQTVLSQNTTPLASPPITDPNTDRRPFKVTDFPTEIERPSLPVTPAPVQRRSFWGAERDEAGDLPAAEGVPEQSDWDPAARLLELQRKQEGMLGQASEADTRTIPNREAISSAAQIKPVQAAGADGAGSNLKGADAQKTTFTPLDGKDTETSTDTLQKTTTAPLTATSTEDTQKTSFTPLQDASAPPEIGIGAQRIMEALRQDNAATSPPPYAATAASGS